MTDVLALSEIAMLARVKRPVVTNWRRRHPDFPAPVSRDGDRLLFPADAVVTWLLEHDYGNTDPDDLRSERALYALAGYAQRHGGRHAVSTLGAALCLRHLAGRELPADPMPLARRLDLDDEFLITELTDAPESAALTGMVEQLIEGAFDVGRAYELLLGAAARLGWSAPGVDVLTPDLVTLIRQVSDVSGRLSANGAVTLADPYAGCGDLLTALLDDHDRDRLRVNAAVADPVLARLTRRRLLLAGLPEFHFDVREDALGEEFADPDLIVTRLPYWPTEARDVLADLDAVEAISDLLRPGRTAVIIGPATSLVDALRDHSAAARRAALLRSDMVEAILLLPGGVFLARPGYPAALWILTRGPVPATRGRVLLADLSGTAMNRQIAASTAEDILLWRAEGHRRDGHDPRTGRITQLAELDLRDGAALRPSGPSLVSLRGRIAEDRPALIGESERQLAQATSAARQYVETHGPLITRTVQRNAPRPADISLGALQKARRIRTLAGHRLNEQHVGPHGHHRVLGTAQVAGQGAARWIDRLILAAEYPNAALTEPGDIVVTTVPRWAVLLDPDGFAVLEFPVRGLRISSGDPLTPPVLTALLAAARNTGRSPGAVRGPRLNDVTIPDLAPDEAGRLDQVLRLIGDHERLIQQQLGILADLRDLAVSGFADGTLTTDSTMYSTAPE